MPDGLVIGQTVVRLGFIRIDRCAAGRERSHEALQSLLVGLLHHFRDHHAGLPILDASDVCFPDCATADVELVLAVLVLLKPAHVGLIHLNGPAEYRCPFFHEGFPDALLHEPCGLLPNPKIPVHST